MAGGVHDLKTPWLKLRALVEVACCFLTKEASEVTGLSCDYLQGISQGEVTKVTLVVGVNGHYVQRSAENKNTRVPQISSQPSSKGRA